MKYAMGYARIMAIAVGHFCAHHGGASRLALIVAHPRVIASLEQELRAGGCYDGVDETKMPPHRFVGVTLVSDEAAAQPYLVDIDRNEFMI